MSYVKLQTAEHLENGDNEKNMHDIIIQSHAIKYERMKINQIE